MQVKERFSFVDALRGIAALAVVLFHAFEGNHIPQLIPVMPRWITDIIDHGNLGVAIFFVLSGFVIAQVALSLVLLVSAGLLIRSNRFVRSG